MRGKKAKRLRRETYGKTDIHERAYFAVPTPHGNGAIQIVADDLRFLYQARKGRRVLLSS